MVDLWPTLFGASKEAWSRPCLGRFEILAILVILTPLVTTPFRSVRSVLGAVAGAGVRQKWTWP